jgi:hypothetical protein
MKTIRRGLLVVPTFVCAATLITALSLSQVGAQPTDPAIGTWELNLTKSQFHPGPAPRSQSRTYEVLTVRGTIRVKGVDAEGRASVVAYPVPQGAAAVKMTAKGIDAEGKPTLMEYTALYDGRDYPFLGNPNADSISLRRVDDFTIEATTKRAGKIATQGKRVISPDGKVMTVTTKGTNASGETVDNVLVFDKR